MAPCFTIGSAAPTSPSPAAPCNSRSLLAARRSSLLRALLELTPENLRSRCAPLSLLCRSRFAYFCQGSRSHSRLRLLQRQRLRPTPPRRSFLRRLRLPL